MCNHCVSIIIFFVFLTYHAKLDAIELVLHRQRSYMVSQNLSQVVYSPDGQAIYAASMLNQIIHYDLRLQEVQILKPSIPEPSSLAVSKNVIIAAGSDHRLYVWRRPGLWQGYLKGHEADINAVAIFGRTIASTSGDYIGSAKNNYLLLHELSGKMLLRVRAHEQPILAVAFSAAGNSIFTASSDHLIREWDLKGQLLNEYRGHDAAVTALAVFPDGQSFVSGADELIFWNKNGKHQIKQIKLEDFPKTKSINIGSDKDQISVSEAVGTFSSIAISADGNMVASAFADKKIRIYNRHGSLLATSDKAHLHERISLDFSPDGHYLVSGCWDRSIKIWHLKANRP